MFLETIRLTFYTCSFNLFAFDFQHFDLDHLDFDSDQLDIRSADYLDHRSTGQHTYQHFNVFITFSKNIV